MIEFLADVPKAFIFVIYFIAIAVLVMCITLTVIRTILLPDSLANDFQNARLKNFFFLPAIIGPLTLLAYPSKPLEIVIKISFFVFAFYQVGLSTHTFAIWLYPGKPTENIYPLMFMQTVGFFMVANIGRWAEIPDFPMFLTYSGVLLWLLVFITNFQHVSTSLQSRREKPSPVFFLFLAPPAHASMTFARGTLRGDAYPTDAMAFLFIDLFFYIIIFRLFPTFCRAPFSVAWWAYVFPLSAAACASLMRCYIGQEIGWKIIAFSQIFLAMIVGVFVAAWTLKEAWEGNIPKNEQSLIAYTRRWEEMHKRPLPSKDLETGDDAANFNSRDIPKTVMDVS